ncbi:Helicase associated domain protein [Arthrobacter sp. UNC362MFTsu5.1]|uniref:Helicase associated domain protein n=1 Tax=Arthrobacter sp. UNC362MFTsu5.1 TaxID=1449044 RepID=UPI000481BC8C|nr:Helicase associated domain protein [Arthrobacter sp. UNC362MFTsu5.1]
MTKRSAAPKAEWVLMYRSGLSRSRIAEVTGVPGSTVGYHLSVARAADPGLESAHKEAMCGNTPRVSAHGLERIRELVAVVQETGRYPSPRAGTAAERSLGVWLERRRREAAQGTLAPEYRTGLGVLPGWQGAARAATDEARWQDRLAALVRYRAAGHDWPRHKATVTGEEHELGVWLHTQRYKARRSELEPAKAQALDESVPGWRTGRQRGRKPGVPGS